MENLPQEVALNILSRLPVSSLMQIKCVCKSWCALAEDSRLRSMHHARVISQNPCLILNSNCQIRNKLQVINIGDGFNQYSSKVRRIDARFKTDMSKFVVIRSINGLVCISNSDCYDPITICNPVIGDYMELPKSTYFPMQEVALEFGYVPSTSQYKVVRFVSYISQLNFQSNDIGSSTSQSGGECCLESLIEVLTLGTDPTWRSIGPLPWCVELKPSQAFVNGVFHWVKVFFEYDPVPRTHLHIISFDLAEDKFRWMELPSLDCLSSSHCHLLVLEGRLSVAHHMVDRRIEIWVMEEYGVEESWNKKYVLGSYVPASQLNSECTRFNLVVCNLTDGKILLQYDGALVLYNPENEQFHDLTISQLPKSFTTVFHVESLLLIEEILGIRSSR